MLDWISANGPGLAEQFLGQWVPAAIGWVAQTAIDIIPKLLGLLGTITDWIITTGVPKLLEFALKMGQAIVQGVLDGLAKLGDAISQSISNAINGINIDLGIFHIHGGNFSVDMPSISLPSFNGGGGGSGGGGSDDWNNRNSWDGTDYNAKRAAGIPGYDLGGIVPGPPGSPQLAIVHGGETVVPPHGVAMPTQNYINITVQGSVVAERDLAETMRRVLLEIGIANVSVGLA